jgi:hypothetical protein
MLYKLARLSCRDLLMLAEALVCVSAIRLALWLVPFRYLRPAPRVAVPHDTDRLTWAILAAASVVPKSSCLVRAMAAQRLFARHGHASDLHIGVAQSVEEGFLAHAWLDLGGEPVIGRMPAGRYTPILSTTSERHA